MSSLAFVTIIHASLLGAQEDGFQRAYQQSAATGRPLVVLIGADWCAACQRMKNSTLPQVARAGGLSNVVFAYVDFDRQRELVSRLSRGKAIPQLIRLERTQAGWSRRVLVGSKSPKEVYSFVKTGPPATAHQRNPAKSARDKTVSPKQAGWTSLFSVTKRLPAQHTQGGNGHTLPK